MKKFTLITILMVMVMMLGTACTPSSSNASNNDQMRDLIPGFICDIQEIRDMSYQEAVDCFKEKAVEDRHYNDTSAEHAEIEKAKTKEGVTENLNFVIKDYEVEVADYKQPTSHGHYKGYNIRYDNGEVTLWIGEKKIPMGALDGKADFATSFKSADNNQYVYNGRKIYLIDNDEVKLLADDYYDFPLMIDGEFYYISENHQLKRGDEVLLENIYGASSNQVNSIYLTLYR